jgi:predicted flap endonuclease-1-like 5' DNA nuclease
MIEKSQKILGKNHPSDLNLASESKILITTIGKEDLTIIKGIGLSIVEKLRKRGLTTIDDIANCKIDSLIRIDGIGLNSATKFIKTAKILRSFKNLTDFT